VIVNFVYPSTHHRTGGVIALYEFANGLARRGNEVHFVHGPAWPHRITSLDELPPFRFEPSIVHHIVDSLDDPSLVAADIVFIGSAPARLGLPIVFVQGYKMWLEELERASFFVRAPKVCIAKWLAGVGLDLGVPAPQLWHVPYGMDHDVFGLRAPLDARHFDIAMLYHPHAEKGWDVGLQVLEEVHRRLPDTRSVVFSRVRITEPLPPGVEFRFAPDHQALADEIYNQSRIFVQVSYHEGFGFTPIEAMGCGCALVTTDNGGSRDYALPGETALVYPPGDAMGLAHGVETLLRDDARRLALATAGERYVRRFDWDVSAEVLEAHLERYLADPAAFQVSGLSDPQEQERLEHLLERFLADPTYGWRDEAAG
jgi:glycosyltransferase involved in cell wall biosynthesis